MPRFARALAQEPRPELRGRELGGLITTLSPGLVAPVHMQRVVDTFESIRPGLSKAVRRARKGRRIVIAAPVQHGKSTIEQHFIVSCLLDDPSYRIALCGYGKDFVNPQSKTTREIARTAGVQFKDDLDTIFMWGTPDDGRAMFTTVGGALTGFGFDCILIDDPFKDRAEVERLDVRENVYTWYAQTVLPRIAPWTDIVVIASRWHVDDLSGRLLGKGFEHVHLKAIQDDGTALWADVRPVEFLREQREAMGPYAFAGNFQGEPYVDSDVGFGDPARYLEVPSWPGFKYVIGFDLAYSADKHSDYFAYAIVKAYGSAAYVVELKRIKSDLRTLTVTLSEASRLYANAPCVSYIAGPEKGAIQYLAREGVRVVGLPARFNKRVRAQRTLDTWKKGRILFPLNAPWLDCLKRFEMFRGHESDPSDEIDALVSAHDYAVSDAVAMPKVFGRPRV